MFLYNIRDITCDVYDTWYIIELVIHIYIYDVYKMDLCIS